MLLFFQKQSLANIFFCSIHTVCSKTSLVIIRGILKSVAVAIIAQNKTKKPKSLNFNAVCGISCDSLRDESVLQGQLLAICD